MRGHVPGRGRGAGGFTLVELLLALTLMSMLLALAYGGLRAATRAADRGQTILEDSSRIRMAHQFVHRQLNQIEPLVFAVSEDGTDRSIFQGDANHIRFVGPMPGYLGFGGPQVQELAIVRGQDGDGLELILSHALLQGFEEQQLRDQEPILLLDGIEDARFSFLGRDENGVLTDWSTTWVDSGTLPASIGLDIEFADEGHIKWPLLTASARIDPAALTDLAGNLGGAGGDRDYSSTIQDMINRRGRNQ